MMHNYMFRYLNADGGFRGMTVMQFNDRHSAEIGAEHFMPKSTASVEIWLGDDLISKESKPRRDISDHKLDFLSHPHVPKSCG
jgi:hypothetical protein